ncbi:MAG: response regulator transcription factor [Treponema sp.]|nr:response regulator transcription factor [Treponema sp.]
MINITVVTKFQEDRIIIANQLSEYNDFHIISEGEDGYHAVMAAMTHKPDIIIMDFYMNDISSIELAPIIKRYSPATALIVLCSEEDANTIDILLCAGISGCILVQEGYSMLASSVRSVFYGGLFLSKPLLNHALNYFSTLKLEKEKNILHYDFSKTEQLVFFGIALGHTDKEIAKDLNITPGSLRNCISSAKRKTGLKNRTQISFCAIFSDMISLVKILSQFYNNKKER